MGSEVAGDTVGAGVGSELDGSGVRTGVGPLNGCSVGGMVCSVAVGITDGVPVSMAGNGVGDADGIMVGAKDGMGVVGTPVGAGEGITDGDPVWNAISLPRSHENPSLLRNLPAPEIAVECCVLLAHAITSLPSLRMNMNMSL